MKLLHILILLLTINCYTQDLNIRKAILKSDLIITSNNYASEINYINDFTKTKHIKIKEVGTVIKNNLTSIPESLTLREYQDNEDYFSEIYTNNDAGILQKIFEEDEIYYNIFFIRKNENKYETLFVLEGLDSKTYKSYVNKIKTLSMVEFITGDQERFNKTLDWFIDNALIPDSDFVTYYTQKKIITSKIQYSNEQYVRAFNWFKKGKESLLPMLRDKYFEEIKAYYIEKLDVVIKKDDLEHRDYYYFYRIVSNFTEKFNHDFDNVNNILNNTLTDNLFSKYEKKRIMKHLLQTIKEWELNIKSKNN